MHNFMGIYYPIHWPPYFTGEIERFDVGATDYEVVDYRGGGLIP
jgi:hypothetical protein